MPPRAMFKGFIQLSLVSVPVKGFTAHATGSEIRLNQLHRDCHSRIKYQKTCPTHGEVKNDDIVSGYEYAKDQYVIINPDEIQKMRKQSEKMVDITGFIEADQIEPIYFSGRTYYFVPDGPAGQKPYQLLRDAMIEENLYALGSAILSGRKQMIVIRPIDELLGMSVLSYAAKVKDTAEFSAEIKKAKFTKEEMQLTKTLIAASRMKSFDLDDYKDHYAEEMKELIEAKVDGQEIVAAPEPEEPKIINLMDALKRSVQSAQGGGEKKTAAKKVRTKMAPSARGSTAKRKRKSG